ELFEAARIDGASYWRLFTKIAMPLSIPSFVIVLLFEFQASWNNLQQALIYLNAGSVDEFTAPLGIAYSMTKYSPTAGGQGDYQYVMVASLMVTMPMLVLFAFGQRYFIERIATTGRNGGGRPPRPRTCRARRSAVRGGPDRPVDAGRRGRAPGRCRRTTMDQLGGEHHGPRWRARPLD